VLIIALKDIKKDEEITIQYLHVAGHYGARREKFADLYGFSCKCKPCKDEVDVGMDSPNPDFESSDFDSSDLGELST
jgi:hypothetical protein